MRGIHQEFLFQYLAEKTCIPTIKAKKEGL